MKFELREVENKLITIVLTIKFSLNQAIIAANNKLTGKEQEMKNIKESVAKNYYEKGLALKKEFEDMPLKLTKKPRCKKLLKDAYDFFTKSYQMGYPEAQREMLILKEKEPYSEYMDK
jgi:hypothetical protein